MLVSSGPQSLLVDDSKIAPGLATRDPLIFLFLPASALSTCLFSFNCRSDSVEYVVSMSILICSAASQTKITSLLVQIDDDADDDGLCCMYILALAAGRRRSPFNLHAASGIEH